MNNTTNYNLEKPSGTDFYNIGDQNDNMDIIDTELKKAENHRNNSSNPHNVTKSDVGLGNVDNTSDANKPISTAMQDALNNKANTSHTQPASTVTEGTFNGSVAVPASTAYGTCQLRNVVFTTTDPQAGTSVDYPNGSIIFVYE